MTQVMAIVGDPIYLPCDISTQDDDDAVLLVLWYREDLGTPIYRYLIIVFVVYLYYVYGGKILQRFPVVSEANAGVCGICTHSKQLGSLVMSATDASYALRFYMLLAYNSHDSYNSRYHRV